MLLVGQRRAFARGADRNEAVGAFGDLPVHQVAEGFFVHGAILERSDERGERPPEPRLGSHDKILDHLVKTAPAAAFHWIIARNSRRGAADKRPPIAFTLGTNSGVRPTVAAFPRNFRFSQSDQCNSYRWRNRRFVLTEGSRRWSRKSVRARSGRSRSRGRLRSRIPRRAHQPSPRRNRPAPPLPNPRRRPSPNRRARRRPTQSQRRRSPIPSPLPKPTAKTTAKPATTTKPPAGRSVAVPLPPVRPGARAASAAAVAPPVAAAAQPSLPKDEGFEGRQTTAASTTLRTARTAECDPAARDHDRHRRRDRCRRRQARDRDGAQRQADRSHRSPPQHLRSGRPEARRMGDPAQRRCGRRLRPLRRVHLGQPDLAEHRHVAAARRSRCLPGADRCRPRARLFLAMAGAFGSRQVRPCPCAPRARRPQGRRGAGAIGLAQRAALAGD